MVVEADGAGVSLEAAGVVADPKMLATGADGVAAAPKTLAAGKFPTACRGYMYVQGARG